MKGNLRSTCSSRFQPDTSQTIARRLRHTLGGGAHATATVPTMYIFPTLEIRPKFLGSLTFLQPRVPLISAASFFHSTTTINNSITHARILLTATMAAASSTPESLPQDAPPSQHTSRKETFHQPEEWELMRPIIRELYIDEKRTLADVSQTLEVTYDFRAT